LVLSLKNVWLRSRNRVLVTDGNFDSSDFLIIHA
jgi:hypothetical protein